jgi:hypothetical protein
MFNVFSARVHKFSESVKECLLGSAAMLPPFILFYDVHSRNNLIRDYSSVVSDTLIDLLINVNTYYIQYALVTLV